MASARQPSPPRDPLVYDVMTVTKVITLVIAIVLFVLAHWFDPAGVMHVLAALMFIITGLLFILAAIVRLTFDRLYGNSTVGPILFGAALFAWGVFGL